jgi:cysteinyl-tRNA synthetase
VLSAALAGVRMEDVGNGKDARSIWKLDDVDVLRKERALKLEVLKAKEQAKLEAARKQQERLEKAKINPNEMFRSMTDVYSAFDEVTSCFRAMVIIL